MESRDQHQQNNRPKVLVFSKYYLPGYKSGGPVRTIQGMADALSDDFEFWIVAQDRDFEDTEPYPDIAADEWNHVGPSRVLYSPKLGRKYLHRIQQDGPWDVLYLQSFFRPNFTLLPLLWWKLGILTANTVLIAPRGEFSREALQQKAFKKRLFLRIANLLGLYKNMHWQASSVAERTDLLNVLPSVSQERVFVALNIPPRCSPPSTTVSHQENNALRIVFLSRINPHKNLSFALDALKRLSIPIEFNIYGPLDCDAAYWASCRAQLESLPDNIRAKHHGPIPPEKIPGLFSEHDLLFLPTRSENFGHVIFEALQAGCSALISDQTPWRDLASHGVGWDLSLNDMPAFQSAILELSRIAPSLRETRRQKCMMFADNFLKTSDAVECNRSMLMTLAQPLSAKI